MARLAGKRVLITGGARGIGLATAREFARAGSHLVLTDLDREGLEAARGELARFGVPVHCRAMDVADRDGVDELARWVVGELGGLDILINNAGIGHQAELAETTIETWQRLLAVNLLGPLYHVYAFLPHFLEKRSGHIVNISSGQAFYRLPTWGAYASVKAALGVFSEVLAFELRKYRIKVTTVYPFMVNTSFYEGIRPRTLAGRMALRLVPLYSMSPEKVARIIFKAVRREARVEMVSFWNDLGLYARVLPLAGDLMGLAGARLLAGRDAGRPPDRGLLPGAGENAFLGEGVEARR